MSREKKYPKTTLFIIDRELWNWARYKALSLGFESVSEYIFQLLKAERMREEGKS